MNPRTMYVYILANPSRMLYVGVTNNIVRRLKEHLFERNPGYTQQYGVTRLVYYEEVVGQWQAIAREKQIKSWTRMKRIELIESRNPGWRDLTSHWIRSSAP